MIIPHIRRVVTFVAIVGLAACSDARLKKLSTGIEKDSVAVIMGNEPHRTQSYQTGGKFWEIMLYARGNEAAEDSVEWGKLTPVVMADGKVAGFGWDYWRKEAETLNIPMPQLK
ncbi:MAG: hypothetical protein ABIR59_00420 [Gemmatimonadales bacterium]